MDDETRELVRLYALQNAVEHGDECSLECPASTDCQGYLAHIANGRPREASKLIKQQTPLAISLGRACFAPCEDECRRQDVEEPLAIRQLKMYAADIKKCIKNR